MIVTPLNEVSDSSSSLPMVFLGQTYWQWIYRYWSEIITTIFYFQAQAAPFTIPPPRYFRNLLCGKMASPASFTIRQVGPEQPEVTVTEPPAEDSTDKPTRRRTIRDKSLKDKEEKKKSRKPPGYIIVTLH